MSTLDTIWNLVKTLYEALHSYIVPLLWVIGGLLLLYFIVRVISAALRKAPKPTADQIAQGEEQQQDKQKSKKEALQHRAALQAAIREGTATLQAHGIYQRQRYDTPWSLMIGATGSGKTSMLAGSNMSTALPAPNETRSGEPNPCNWWFFNNGVVLDIDGAFHLGADNNESVEQETWATLLGAIANARPERPLDSIVLTFAADTLLQSTSQDDITALQRSAERLYDRLVAAQKIVGLRLPIYVLITKCDVLTGFAPFVQALPPDMQESMLGWSNPYSLETAYTSDLSKEAFASVQEILQNYQLEIFATAPNSSENDDIFVLPQALGALRKGTSIVLDTIFRSNAYAESFFFRGLYFVGTSQVAHSATQQFIRTNIAFVRDVFEKKIFLESRLVRPATRTFVERNRTLNLARAASFLLVIGCTLGLWFGYGTLQERKNMLYPVLKEMSDDLRNEQIALDSSQQQMTQINALQLFSKYSRSFDSDLRVFSIFYPSSWFSPLHDEISTAMAITYNTIVARGISHAMEFKISSTLAYQEQSNQPFTPSDVKILSLGVRRLPQYISLEDFVQQIKTLEQHINIYNSSAQEGYNTSLENYAELIDYLYNQNLPRQNNYHNHYYFSRALRKVRYSPINIKSYNAQAGDKLRKLAQDLSNTLFLENPITNIVTNLQKIEREASVSPPQSAASGAILCLRMNEQLNALATVEENKNLSWLQDKEFVTSDRLGNLTSSVLSSEFFSPDDEQQVRKILENGFSTLKTTLESNNMLFGIKLFTTTNNGVALSEQTKTFRSVLTDLSSRSFMLQIQQNDSAAQAAEDVLPTSVRMKNNLIWDKVALLQANAQALSYEKYVAADIQHFPQQAIPLFQSIAAKNFDVSMRRAVASLLKENPLSGAALGLSADTDSEVANFVAASQDLALLTSSIERLNALSARQDLLSMMGAELTDLLNTIDQSANTLYSYSANGLQQWDGYAPLTRFLFGARSKGQVQDYLHNQNMEITQLAAESAKPLIVFIGNLKIPSSYIKSSLVSKWTSIVKVCEQYQKSQPDNSLQVLENFIAGTVDSINVTNFTSLIQDNDIAIRSTNDYFQDKLNRLRLAIYRTAESMADKTALDGYNVIAEYFNEKIAGRFPFSLSMGDEDDLQEARPEDVKEFLRLYNNYYSIAGKAIQRLSATDTTAKRINDFLNSVKAVKDFIGDPAKATDTWPSFNLLIEFRVNRQIEINGNQIADWKMSSGNKSINYNDSVNEMPWSYGMPVRLALRWAKNSPFIPDIYQDYQAMRIENETVFFDYTSRWGLLAFLKNHQARPVEYLRIAPQEATVLKFTIPTLSSVSKQRNNTETVVFTKVAVVSSTTKQTVQFPRFPVTAPIFTK